MVLEHVDPRTRGDGEEAQELARARRREQELLGIAGALGVAVTDRLCVIGAIDEASLALLDEAPFRGLGIDVVALARRRRPLTRSCQDWSERRPHLAGALGAAVLDAMLSRHWLVRRPHSRALTTTAEGRRRLVEQFGVGVDPP